MQLEATDRVQVSPYPNPNQMAARYLRSRMPLFNTAGQSAAEDELKAKSLTGFIESQTHVALS